MKIKLTFKKAVCPFCGDVNIDDGIIIFGKWTRDFETTCRHNDGSRSGWMNFNNWFEIMEKSSDKLNNKSIRYEVVKKEIEI